jgi:hypothetical protein
VGHGWLNIVGKKGLISQYNALRFSDAATIAHYIGLFEILSGFLILIRPFRPFIFFLLLWKMATELFYPHYEFFEWVERGGSYCTLLALWVVADKVKMKNFISFSVLHVI